MSMSRSNELSPEPPRPPSCFAPRLSATWSRSLRLARSCPRNRPTSIPSQHPASYSTRSMPPSGSPPSLPRLRGRAGWGRTAFDRLLCFIFVSRFVLPAPARVATMLGTDECEARRDLYARCPRRRAEPRHRWLPAEPKRDHLYGGRALPYGRHPAASRRPGRPGRSLLRSGCRDDAERVVAAGRLQRPGVRGAKAQKQALDQLRAGSASSFPTTLNPGIG